MNTDTDTEIDESEETSADDTEPAVVDAPVEDAAATTSIPNQAGERPSRARVPTHRLVLIMGLSMVVALGALAGWLGSRAHQSHQAAEQRAVFLQVGRQAALNLTTIDWQHADADVQRILNTASDTFYDDFSKRAQPFIDVVKQAHSKSEGTVTEAGLESASSNEAQVLVALSVNISNAGAREQNPRAWRMRISVRKVADDVKVSNVEFVP